MCWQSGGPFWNVELGRQDGTTASKAAANNSIPTPLANVLQLVSRFNAVGLSEQDVVIAGGSLLTTNTTLLFLCFVSMISVFSN